MKSDINDEIGAALQSWIWVRVELVAWEPVGWKVWTEFSGRRFKFHPFKLSIVTSKTPSVVNTKYTFIWYSYKLWRTEFQIYFLTSNYSVWISVLLILLLLSGRFYSFKKNWQLCLHLLVFFKKKSIFVS